MVPRMILAAWWPPSPTRVFTTSTRRTAGSAQPAIQRLARARGEYLAFLDSDDLFLPEKLAVQVAQLDADPALGMVAGGFRYIDWQGGWLAERRPWVFQPTLDLSTVLLGAAIITNSVLLRKEWIERVGDVQSEVVLGRRPGLVAAPGGCWLPDELDAGGGMRLPHARRPGCARRGQAKPGHLAGVRGAV